MSRWRQPLGLVFAVVACVLVPLALVAVRLMPPITDTDTYVDTVAPLAVDQTVMSAVADTVTEQTLAWLDIPGRGAALIDTLAERNPIWRALPTEEAIARLTTMAHESVAKAADAAVRTEAFQQLWVAANRVVHTELIAALDGNSEVLSDDGWLEIDLTGLARAVLVSASADRPSLAAIIDQVPLRSQVITVQVTDRLTVNLTRLGYRMLDGGSVGYPLAWLICLLAAFGFGTRRQAITEVIVFGSGVGLTLLGLGLWAGRFRLIDVADPDSKPVVKLIADQLLTPLWEAIGLSFVVVLAAAIVVAFLRRRSGSETVIAPGPPPGAQKGGTV